MQAEHCRAEVHRASGPYISREILTFGRPDTPRWRTEGKSKEPDLNGLPVQLPTPSRHAASGHAHDTDLVADVEIASLHQTAFVGEDHDLS